MSDSLGPNRKIVEISFGATYVRKPHSRQNANVLRLRGHTDANASDSDMDGFEEFPHGVQATREYQGFRYTSLYPWALIHDVKYEPEDLRPKEETKKETKASATKPGKLQISMADEA